MWKFHIEMSSWKVYRRVKRQYIILFYPLHSLIIPDRSLGL